MANVRGEESEIDVAFPEDRSVEYIDDARAQALTGKHMSRWSVLLDRLK
jgi:hypothetical protein